jgi:hypothetical protein
LASIPTYTQLLHETERAVKLAFRHRVWRRLRQETRAILYWFKQQRWPIPPRFIIKSCLDDLRALLAQTKRVFRLALQSAIADAEKIVENLRQATSKWFPRPTFFDDQYARWLAVCQINDTTIYRW